MCFMIREYRKKKGLTQEQLAERLSISTRQLQRIEKNETKTSIETLNRIREVLNISDEDIVKILKKEKKKDLISQK